MFRRVAYLFAIVIFLGSSLAWAQEKKEDVLALTLEETIIRTLKNNYGVAIQIINPEIDSLAIKKAKEKYLPTLALGYDKRDTKSASFSWLDAAEQVSTEYYGYDAQVTQLLPTGGRVGASLVNYRNFTTSKFQTVNPRYSSTLRLNFEQPLLKGFGAKMTNYDIHISQNDFEISQNDLEATVADIIDVVTQAYWDLAYSIDNLKVRQQALDLARDLLAKNQRAVEVGTLAPIEILSAQAEVATREAEILSAEAEVKNNEDRLRTIINLPEEEMKLALPIKPLDAPKFVERQIDVDEALMTALENRPELKSLRVGLKSQDLTVSYAKNQLFPDLSLTASYWSPGISGDQILYENNNPLTGKIVGIVPGGIGGAVDDALGFRYRNWSVGLTLDIPLNSVFSKAAYTQAKLNLEQAVLRLKNQEQTIYLEIRNGVRNVETNYKRVQSYRVARELADKKLQAEEEKLKVGLSTNFIVLTYQRDLSNARSSELRAIVDYIISVSSLEKAMGTNLENHNITLDEVMSVS
ncbi:MAG: TolC family protein [Candidatus Aminicenantales bacterium]